MSFAIFTLSRAIAISILDKEFLDIEVWFSSAFLITSRSFGGNSLLKSGYFSNDSKIDSFFLVRLEIRSF